MTTDNTQLPAASTVGDLIRSIAKTVNGIAKTQAITLDIGGGVDASPEIILTAGQQGKAQSLPTVPAFDLSNIEPAGAPITGASMPSGGVGLTGWLSAILAKLGAVVLAGGSAIIGKVGFDQTTPGVTNGVVVNSSATLPTTETYVNVTGNSPLATGASAVPVVASRAGRKEVTIYNEGGVAVRIGGASVTPTTNGILIAAGGYITVSGGAALYGASASASSISSLEIF